MEIRQERVRVNGTVLWTAREGTGVPVVLCHGGPGGYDDLGPVAAMIADLAVVHRYDQRGCGRSERRPPYDLETYLADLDGLRAHCGYDRWMVGGHSWGANLALAYALRYPHRVRGLIYLCGTGLSQGWKEEYRANRWARLRPEERERWHDLRAALKGPWARPDDPELAALSAEYRRLYMATDFADRRNLPAPGDEGLTDNHEVNALLNAEWERFAAAVTPARLAALRCPALFVHGAADPRPG